MCIFSGPISHVSSTKILVSTVMQAKKVLVRDNYGKTRQVRRPAMETKPLQLTVYSNAVEINGGATSEQTAMILPFPLIKGKNRVRLLDLSKCTDLFKNLDKMFKSKKHVMNLDEVTAYFTNEALPVHSVGNYVASIVPNFESFDNLQYKQFGLSPEVKTLLKQYYEKRYGFIVCILRQNAEYHPFGYMHELRADGKLFVPTRHYHARGTNTTRLSAQTRMPGEEYDESIDDIENFMAKTMIDADPYLSLSVKRNTLSVNRDVPDVDWDHSIYVLNYPRVLADERYKKEYMDVKPADPGRLYRIDKYFDIGSFPSCIIFPTIKSVQRLNIYPGYKSNHDLLI